MCIFFKYLTIFTARLLADYYCDELGNEIVCKWICPGRKFDVGWWLRFCPGRVSYGIIWGRPCMDPIFNDLLVARDLWGRKKPGTVSRSLRQHIDGNSIIFQQTGAKVSTRSEAYTVKLSVMEIGQCEVNCTFQCSFSHEPVIKPN